MTTLITGGAGFIGSALAARLLAGGDRVVVLDSLHPQVHAAQGWPEALPEGAELLVGDVTDQRSVEMALDRAGPAVLVHLAAETGTGQSLTEATRHASANVVGLTRVLDAFARRDGLSQVVLASSRAVYGEGTWRSRAGNFSPPPRTPDQLAAGRWDPEAPDGGPAVPVPALAGVTEPRPVSVYAATKLAQEHVVRAWATGHRVPFSILRLQNVFGPGQSPTNTYSGVVALFVATAMRGGTVDVYEDGAILRDFVYVDDAARALAAAVHRPPPSERLVDIGSGTATTLLDLAGAIARLCDAPDPVVSGRFRPGDVRAASCDISAAAADLGFRPRWSLERSLPPLLEWMAAQPKAPASE